MTTTTTTRSEWADDMERIEARIEPFLLLTPSGERYIDLPNTPGPLVMAHESLTHIGLQNGWLTLDDNGNATLSQEA
ncbi:MAG: hypothetical protein K0S37_785 [Microbacterium sp.]|jgi:hypothetical protein|nr:hypothetical protein [Microbacterium sp.]